MSDLIDAGIHYAMAFVNPKGVEVIMNSRRIGDAYKGFVIVNKEAEEKTQKAKAGEVITPHPDRSIADRVKRRRERLAKPVQQSTLEVEA